MEYRELDMLDAASKGYLPADRPLAWALRYRSYPVVSFELVNFVRWYPICFEEKAEGIRMVMPVSLEPGDSVLINRETGRWIGRSMPFFLRRFPFVLGYEDIGDGKARRKLMIADIPEAALSPEAPRKVIDSAGHFTPMAKNMMNRMVRYDTCLAADRKRTALFKELDLFVPWKLDLGQEDSGSTPYLQIDEKRLLELPEKAVFRLHEMKAWRMIFGHLYSLSLSQRPKNFLDRIQSGKDQAAQGLLGDIFNDDGGLIEF